MSGVPVLRLAHVGGSFLSMSGGTAPKTDSVLRPYFSRIFVMKEPSLEFESTSAVVDWTRMLRFNMSQVCNSFEKF